MDSIDREFFLDIKEAITSNPFSSARRRVDLKLTGAAESEMEPGEIQAKLLDRVTQRLAVYEKKYGGTSPRSSENHVLYRNGKLFELFHRHVGGFDELIQDQIQRGDESCQVKFAGDILGQLSRAGIQDRESLRYLALFYQMRRAFFFIGSISGQSPCVRELKKALWNNIFTADLELYDSYLWNRMEDFSTMLLGETGTGKGLAASAIGRSGFIPFDDKRGCFRESFARNFISINLSQYPVQLIESELFGHRKGAFTGAVESHSGLLARCSPHGAIFIDEIGDVAIPIQIKLLQVLQERAFTPVGSHSLEKFQGRVIAATNQPLKQLRMDGRFREDFYYRLCSDVIEVPPLRKRLEENPAELPLVLSFIIERIIGMPSPSLVEQVSETISGQAPEKYRWPGNIRELEQCVRQILLNRSYRWQQREHNPTEDPADAFREGHMTASQLLSAYCQTLYRRFGSYEAVAKVTGLDRRTVKKHVFRNAMSSDQGKNDPIVSS